MSARRNELLKTAQFELLKELANNVEADPRSVMCYAETLARSYETAKKHKAARGYFDMAGHAARQVMRQSERSEKKRHDQRADLYLNTAVLQWHAGRRDSNNFFRTALLLYKFGADSEETGVQLRCHQGTVYCNLFLKDFDAALSAAIITNHLENQFGLPVQVLWSELLLDVIKKCQQDSAQAYREASALVDEFIHQARNDLYYRNGLMLTDLRTLLNRYARAAAKAAE